MLFRVFWKLNGDSFRGFVKAKTRTGAIRIAKRLLIDDCIITGCVEAFEFQIMPKDITLNFNNISDYKLFG